MATQSPLLAQPSHYHENINVIIVAQVIVALKGAKKKSWEAFELACQLEENRIIVLTLRSTHFRKQFAYT